MKGGITGRLQEAKLRRLDKSLIEGRRLLKFSKGGGKRSLASFSWPTTT